MKLLILGDLACPEKEDVIKLRNLKFSSFLVTRNKFYIYKETLIYKHYTIIDLILNYIFNNYPYSIFNSLFIIFRK